jgi:hypothetical protein
MQFSSAALLLYRNKKKEKDSTKIDVQANIGSQNAH